MNTTEINDYIQSRRSLYPAQMLPGAKIPDEHIWEMLENANYAPSHKRTEPWRFHVFAADAMDEIIDQMLAIHLKVNPDQDENSLKSKKILDRKNYLSHIIAISVSRDEKERVPYFEEEYATACAVQNFLLSMNAYNATGYWSTGKIAFHEDMKTYLSLPEKDKCMGFLLLGVPNPELNLPPKKQMSPIQDKVIWRD